MTRLGGGLHVGLRKWELRPAAEVRQVFGSCVHAIRAGLLSLPTSVAVRGVVAAHKGSSAVEAILKTQVYDVLRALAQWPGGLCTGPDQKAEWSRR
jgi:hypothetical protein